MSRFHLMEGGVLEQMTGIKVDSVDAVIMDPPYCSGGISEASRKRASGQGLRSETIQRFGWFEGDNMGTAGLCGLLRSVARESLRVLQRGGSLCVFCDWRMLTSLQPAIESAGLRYVGLGVWDKGSMGLGVGFRPRHELIMHFTNGVGTFYDKSISNVLTAKRVHKSKREHHTQKPVELMQQLVKVVAPTGGAVVDPFMGSGSTGVAALSLGVNFIGIEQDAGHLATARRRLLGVDGAQEV